MHFSHFFSVYYRCLFEKFRCKFVLFFFEFFGLFESGRWIQLIDQAGQKDNFRRNTGESLYSMKNI